jgi:metallo-beta-lactamase family protein
MARGNGGPVTVTFWGAAHTVTGSMHLLDTGREKVLLDCGLYQGRRSEARERNCCFPFAPKDIAAVILSHAHIDHCGNLPNLVRQGFRGTIYCTPATRDLAAIMLADSAKIQAEDADYLNRKRGKDEPKVEPLYDQDDVRRTLTLVEGTPYDKTRRATNTVAYQLLDAGHLLGSAIVHVTAEAGRAARTITFTGDLGRANQPILRDPAPLPPADLLISESTYGGRNHPNPDLLATDLAGVVERTVARGGKIVVPAFAVGRTQTIVFFLHQLVAAGRIPRLPIFVDSPLSTAATEVFRLHPECFDAETARVLVNDPDLFGSELVHYTRNVEESKQLNFFQGPCIIIASSGMCESGRIQHHLKHTVEDPRNTILIIGYQAPETLGRRIVERRPEVRIHGQMWKLKAEVVVLYGFSGHAGRDELLAMLAPIQGAVKKTCLVHGEPDQAEALAKTLRERGFADVEYPARGDSVTVE